MKKVQVSEFGDRDVLKFVTAPDPAPGATEVTIDVNYIGMGLIDAMMRRGFVPLPLPFTPGLEVSGHIKAVGPKVTGFSVGEPVVALLLLNLGGYATVVKAPATAVISLRDISVDLASAAAVIVNFTTAYLALKTIAHVDEGSAVMVHGASGGLGTACCKMARALNASFVAGTTSSPDKLRYIQSLGVDLAVMARNIRGHIPQFESLGGFDVIADPVGGEVRRESLDLLKQRGRLLVMGGASHGDEVSLSSTEIWLKNVEVLGVNIGGLSQQTPAAVGTAGADVIRMLSRGAVEAGAVKILPFEQVAEAHRLLESKSVSGKLLLAV
jgi:NADPH2:quinone reductase